MAFQLKSINSNLIFEKSDILQLTEYFEDYAHKNNLDFFIVKAGYDIYSLLNMTALFISNISYSVMPEDIDNNKIKNLFNSKKIFIIENEEKSFFNPKNIRRDISENRIYKIKNNEKRKILYLSSGSTGNPKLIEMTSKSAYTCHEKVIKVLNIKKNIKNIICFHSNSFVISLNYIMLGILGDLTLLTIYKVSPLKLISCLKKKGGESLVISVPSYWEKLSKVLESQSIKINTLISCGEPLKFDTARRLNNIKIKNLFNFYGATEFATWIFYFKITKKYIEDYKNKKESIVPIGNPLSDVKFTIEDNGSIGVSCNHMSSIYIKENFTIEKIEYKNLKELKYIYIGDRIEIRDNHVYCIGRIDGLTKIKGIFVDLFILQEKIILTCKERQFLLVVGKDEVLYLFLDVKDLTNNQKGLLKKDLYHNLSLFINKNIKLKIICEENGLRLNRSSKVDRFFYKKIVTQ